MKIALVKTSDRMHFAWNGEAWEPCETATLEGVDVVSLRPLAGLEVIAVQTQTTEDPVRVLKDTLSTTITEWNGEPAPKELVAELPLGPLTALFEAWQRVQTGPLSGDA